MQRRANHLLELLSRPFHGGGRMRPLARKAGRKACWDRRMWVPRPGPQATVNWTTAPRCVLAGLRRCSSTASNNRCRRTPSPDSSDGGKGPNGHDPKHRRRVANQQTDGGERRWGSSQATCPLDGWMAAGPLHPSADGWTTFLRLRCLPCSPRNETSSGPKTWRSSLLCLPTKKERALLVHFGTRSILKCLCHFPRGASWKWSHDGGRKKEICYCFFCIDHHGARGGARRTVTSRVGRILRVLFAVHLPTAAAKWWVCGQDEVVRNQPARRGPPFTRAE